MRWNIKDTDGSVSGPFEEQDVVASLRAGHYSGAVIGQEGSAAWKPVAAHPPFASAMASSVQHAEGTKARTSSGGGEGIGTALLLIPLGATVLTWVWVGNMNLLQNPSGSLWTLAFGAVIATAVLMAIEAGQLGMGTVNNSKGKKDSGAVGWFLAACMFWVAAYPYYLARRSLYGRKSLVVGGAPGRRSLLRLDICHE